VAAVTTGMDERGLSLRARMGRLVIPRRAWEMGAQILDNGKVVLGGTYHRGRKYSSCVSCRERTDEDYVTGRD